jgi:hypothetical protein
MMATIGTVLWNFDLVARLAGDGRNMASIPQPVPVAFPLQSIQSVLMPLTVKSVGLVAPVAVHSASYSLL